MQVHTKKPIQAPHRQMGGRFVRRAHSGPASDRRGSVLLVTIGLLGMLLLLGIAFYTFSSQEVANSQNYADAAKAADAGLSPDKLWEFALEQLIVGPSLTDTSKSQSALWGRRHALLTGVLGRSASANFDGFDLSPYNGTGINLKYLTTGFVGDPYVDLDNNDFPDAAQGLLNFNYSAAANPGGVAVNPPTFPATDVDYSRPDLNSLALSYIGRGLDSTNTDVKVIIPSFHRPQLLRKNGGPIPNWYTDAGTAQKVLRPHPEHLCAGGGNYRFLSNQHGGPGTNVLGESVAVFPFGSPATVQQGVWDLPGAPIPPIGPQTYQWDVDNDGDGIKEGIWMDLDFPVQTLADGRSFVPLFSFTVVDADGLINLNVSGNQSGFTLPGGGPFALGGGLHLSRSNMGTSRAEISPAWAMLGNPGSEPSSATTQHNLFWNIAPGALNRMEMANAETLFLNIGRPEFSTVAGGTYTMPVAASPNYEPSQYYPGRYDELELYGENAYTGSGHGIAGYKQGGSRDLTALPQPGRSNVLYGSGMNPFAGDDDQDATLGHSHFDSAGYIFMGNSFYSSQSNAAVAPFVHPLDNWGNGVGVQSGPNGVKMWIGNGGAGGVSQWPYYFYGYSSPGNDTTMSNFLSYTSASGGGSTMLPSSYASQTDEPDEVVAEWGVANSHPAMLQDDVFGPDNMLELQATNTDLTNISLQGRMRDLAPFNFDVSSQSQAIRQQFTVLSHDRRNFGLGGMGPNSNLRPGEFNNSDGIGGVDFPPSYSAAKEPFRPALMRLLHVDTNRPTLPTGLEQLRLNLNKFLASYDNINGPSTPNGPVGMPVYRDLTPHPVSLPNTPIAGYTWDANNPNGGTPSPNDQEYWARYDRQMMARDIYVLLYTLGVGNDAKSPVTTSNALQTQMMTGIVYRSLYDNSQLREMAQFAVNVVDALDHDDVITKFEYDKDLNNGWDLDNNPYNSATDPETSNADRGVVYGVEAQKLTFSEILGINSREGKDSTGNPADYEATQIKDSDGDRLFTYIELRNASPFQIDLSSGQWQIAVVDRQDPDGTPNNGDEYDADRTLLTLLSGGASQYIAPGALFTIGTRGGPAATDPMMAGKNIRSILKVDQNGNSPPDFTSPTTFVAPIAGANLDLDLIPVMGSTHDNTLSLIAVPPAPSSSNVKDGNPLGEGTNGTNAGNFLYTGPGGTVPDPSQPTTFVLRRRAHPTRARPVAYPSTGNTDQTIDNPWIEVDRMVLSKWTDFDLQKGSVPSGMYPPIATDVQDALSRILSFERAQPFARLLQEANFTIAKATVPNVYNSLGLVNSNLPTPNFTQFQLHFDRDFASVVDLLSIPLYGPAEVTRRVGQRAMFNNTASTSFLAQERFLRPQHYDNLTGGPVPVPAPDRMPPDNDNRWYRLLEFIEVPTNTQSSLRSYPYALTTAGALQLNMIRTRGVLAGLIDDQDNPFSGPPAIEGHFNPNYPNEPSMLNDVMEPGRDWWYQFLRSRDGIDPLTGLILPGTPVGRPFRALGFMENGINSLDDTVFRTLPLDELVMPPPTPAQRADRRSMFEARTTSDRPSNGGADTVDPYTKNRLLRKVVNNSTTRSNVFAVWITTRYFEAIPVPSTPDVQIGDVLKGAKDHRGFFVIDRSQLEQAFQPNTGKFDFRKFVQYRKTLQ